MTADVATLAGLPDSAAALFEAPGQGSLFATRAWFDCVIAAALPPDAQPHFVTLAQAGRVRALVAMQSRADGRRMESLTTPYTCLWRPLLGGGLARSELAALGGAFGRFCRRWATVRLDAMPAYAPEVAAFLAGTRHAGLGAVSFDHFANWHEAVAGLSWQDYLRARPGSLRETIRRKLARAERDGEVTFEILTAPADAARAVATFEAVYGRSWKQSEPFPQFNPALIASAAELGVLRLGVLQQSGEAVAVQMWVVSGGIATVLKLAHDERAKSLSPGTVLTAMMIRSLIEAEHVAGIDFGRGDDPYKQGWASQRRERIGVVLFNPLHPGGAAFALRHLAGRVIRRLRRPRAGS